MLILKNLEHFRFLPIRQILWFAPVRVRIAYVRFHSERPDKAASQWPRSLPSIMEHMSPRVSIDRDLVSAFCRRHHVQRLSLFGSVLRDDFGPDSDVDVLVEFQAGHVPGFNFISIEREFSGLLHGRRVDMVTPKFLNPRIRDQVLSSAEPLYVAA